MALIVPRCKEAVVCAHTAGGPERMGGVCSNSVIINTHDQTAPRTSFISRFKQSAKDIETLQANRAKANAAKGAHPQATDNPVAVCTAAAALLRLLVVLVALRALLEDPLSVMALGPRHQQF